MKNSNISSAIETVQIYDRKINEVQLIFRHGPTKKLLAYDQNVTYPPPPNKLDLFIMRFDIRNCVDHCSFCLQTTLLVLILRDTEYAVFSSKFTKRNNPDALKV